MTLELLHNCNLAHELLHNCKLAPDLLHNCKLAPELLHNYKLTPELLKISFLALEFLKNSNQVLTVDFSRNSLLLATFRAESGVGLVGPGDGGPFRAMGFAGGGQTAADRAFFLSADDARGVFRRSVAFQGVSSATIGAGRFGQRWGSLGTP